MLEGLVCVVTALPLAIPTALLGATVGRVIALRRPGAALHAVVLVLAVPGVAALETAGPPPVVREIVSAIEVQAPPEVVWRHVAAFREIPDTPAWFFRLGIAYPLRAVMDGEGVGALRRCEFSTGVPGADHRLGRATAVVIRRRGTARPDARADALQRCPSAASRRDLSRAARGVQASCAAGRSHAPGRQHLVHARHDAERVLGLLGRFPDARDPRSRARPRQAAGGERRPFGAPMSIKPPGRAGRRGPRSRTGGWTGRRCGRRRGRGP